MKSNFLEVKNLSKHYQATIALHNVNCSFEQGKIHALLGKNGSGKSTFANIISGIVTATEGSIYINQKEVHFTNPQQAIKEGVAVIHQEMSLIPSLSVAENIFLGRYKTKKNSKIIDWKATEKECSAILDKLGIDINPKTLVSALSIGKQQQIEIAKAITENPKLLILDEPTSALALQEVDILFSIMRNLRDNGVTMIYISHRLQELTQIADTINVLRDGEFVGSLSIAEATHESVLQLMFGRVSRLEKKEVRSTNLSKKVLEVKNLGRKPFYKNISFSLYEGEVLGIAGLMGSGRTELLRSIYGLDAFDSGEVLIQNQEIKHISPSHMKALGLSYVSEDRKEEGLVLILSIHTNIILASMNSIAYKNFYINQKREEPYVSTQIKNLDIKVANRFFPVSSLSGGNQQKVVVANWLNTSPKIMLFDEPSRGIDVEAKQHIFRIIWQQKKQGVSTLMISSELEELHEVCDRILILKDGTISEELRPSDITTNQLYSKCMTK